MISALSFIQLRVNLLQWSWWFVLVEVSIKRDFIPDDADLFVSLVTLAVVRLELHELVTVLERSVDRIGGHGLEPMGAKLGNFPATNLGGHAAVHRIDGWQCVLHRLVVAGDNLTAEPSIEIDDHGCT